MPLKQRIKRDVKLSQSELERYDRQLLIRGWGEEAQLKLKEARVLIAGAGGLGCPAALYLTAAGAGYVAIVDKEHVELSNLNRQVLHWALDVGELKSASAARKLRQLNPDVQVDVILEEIDERSCPRLVNGFDVVVDGMDNWRARFILNEECVKRGVPFVHAGIRAWYGQIMTIMPGEGPCLRCLLPKSPPEVKRFPVVGVTPGVLGLLEASEAIKILTGLGEPLVGRMLYIDLESMRVDEIKVERRADCPICSSIGKALKP